MPGDRIPKYWPAFRWTRRVIFALGVLIAALCLLVQGGNALYGGMAIGGVLTLFAFQLWLLERREAGEIKRFEERTKSSGGGFLGDLGIHPSSALAAKVLAMRCRLAELAGVPPESIHAADRFEVELASLPYYDSIDFLDLVFILEKELGSKIPRDQVVKDSHGTSFHQITVQELILSAVAATRERAEKQGEDRP